MDNLNNSKIVKALNWAYDLAVDGGPGLDSAIELAGNYTKKNGSTIEQVNSLIRWQNAKAGTSGFISGLGGIITLPVTIPANISSVMYVQVRMIAAIAHIGGHDLKHDQVRTLTYMCLTGNAAKDIAKDVGINFGTKLTASAIQAIPGKTIVAINQAVGFRLLTKFGEKGVINLGKVVPLAGGVIGATLDAVATNKIGNVARNTFVLE